MTGHYTPPQPAVPEAPIQLPPIPPSAGAICLLAGVFCCAVAVWYVNTFPTRLDPFPDDITQAFRVGVEKGYQAGLKAAVPGMEVCQ